MEIEKVLQEYRDGDEAKRLSLFLAFRDLREYFENIEQETSGEQVFQLRFPWRRRQGLARVA